MLMTRDWMPSAVSRSCARTQLHPAEPGVPQLLPTQAHPLVEALVNSVRHEELGVFGPAVVALGQANFVLAQRLTMGGTGVLPVGRAPTDVAVDDDQRRPLALLEEDGEGAVEHVEIVGVPHPGDVRAPCRRCWPILVQAVRSLSRRPTSSGTPGGRGSGYATDGTP
jgi:hypothetical protein